MYNIDRKTKSSKKITSHPEEGTPTESYSMEPSSNIMLTLNLGDSGAGRGPSQCETNLPKNRFQKVTSFYRSFELHLHQFFKETTSCIEISSCLNSCGQSRYPRIHSHIVGVVKDPLGLLMYLSYLVNAQNCSYHIARLQTETDLKEKHEYIQKEKKRWKAFNKNMKIHDIKFLPITKYREGE